MNKEKFAQTQEPRNESLRNRFKYSKMGKRATVGLVTLGLIGGASEGVKHVARDASQNTVQISKDPSKDINANPNLSEQFQLGGQRVTLNGEKALSPSEVQRPLNDPAETPQPPKEAPGKNPKDVITIQNNSFLDVGSEAQLAPGASENDSKTIGDYARPLNNDIIKNLQTLPRPRTISSPNAIHDRSIPSGDGAGQTNHGSAGNPDGL